MSGFSDKLLPILNTLINELAAISYAGLIVMLAVGGVLIMIGNEHGGKKVCKNALYGFIIIRLAAMLI